MNFFGFLHILRFLKQLFAYFAENLLNIEKRKVAVFTPKDEIVL